MDFGKVYAMTRAACYATILVIARHVRRHNMTHATCYATALRDKLLEKLHRLRALIYVQMLIETFMENEIQCGKIMRKVLR
jgi:hypothetical protein